MKRADFPWKAAAAAMSVIREYGVLGLPVDPTAIAKKAGIEVVAKPASAKGVSGLLIRQGNQFGIAYATHIESPGFRNFSVAHELGHYFLEGHAEAVIGADGMHESRAGFSSDDKYELEADQFAAELLMPESLFRAAADQAGEGLAAIESLSALCITSLTATAIRYTQCTGGAVAIVMSTGNRVNYCFMSDSFEQLAGVNRIRKGEQVPPGTPTATLSSDAERVAKAERLTGSSALQDWLGGPHEIDLVEEVAGLGAYGRTLTVLTTREDVDLEEIEEDEELVASWKPRFRR